MDWNYWGPIVATGITTLLGGTLIGAMLTFVTGQREFGLRRQVETLRLFMEASRRAHGYADESGGTVGTGEQIAAIYLVAGLARRYKWLTDAGVYQLREQTTWLEAHLAKALAAEQAAKDEAEAVESRTVIGNMGRDWETGQPVILPPSATREQAQAARQKWVAAVSARETAERMHKAALEATAKIRT